jgi:hypothetical protein
MNGMIIALQGAKKNIFEGGEHFEWIGGKELLIDTNNYVLIENFKFDYNINFYSLKVTSQPFLDTIRQNFKTNNGQYYSFIDYRKEFNVWLKTSFLENLTKTNLLNATYKEITFWKEPNGWTSESKESFIERNYELIKSKLLQLNSKDCDYNIFDENLNMLIYESDDYKDYFNNCGEPKGWIYPVKNIVISYRNNNDLVQDHFEFLRTENGYKLISITIRNEELK